jgi:hypothetical protein
MSCVVLLGLMVAQFSRNLNKISDTFISVNSVYASAEMFQSI